MKYVGKALGTAFVQFFPGRDCPCVTLCTFFVNPVFKSGLNMIVRNGSTWMKKLEIGDELFLRDVETGQIVAKGAVYGKAYVPFRMLADGSWLYLQHDPLCCDYYGLLAAMRRLYPGFKTGNYVSIIFFAITAA